MSRLESSLLQALERTSIHPFPARMGPSIALGALFAIDRPMKVLDPMAGSGTTLVTARALGHEAIGFDLDPLAVLIAQGWCLDVDVRSLEEAALKVLREAERTWETLSDDNAFPPKASPKTKAFIQFWYDPINRRQLTALSNAIRRVRSQETRTLLWCGLSRLIITKKRGVSLGADISHSRPHRVYRHAPVQALHRFMAEIRRISCRTPFASGQSRLPTARVRRGDARQLPLPDESIDFVITSPPYLNGIDYMRGHKFALVWMGNSIEHLTKLRANSVGSDQTSRGSTVGFFAAQLPNKLRNSLELPNRLTNMIVRYFSDMDQILGEIFRVLIPRGRVILVLGDSRLRGMYLETSAAITDIAERNGFTVDSARRRPLPDNRRYLPPPTSKLAGLQLQKRVREEVILSMHKPTEKTSSTGDRARFGTPGGCLPPLSRLPNT